MKRTRLPIAVLTLLSLVVLHPGSASAETERPPASGGRVLAELGGGIGMGLLGMFGGLLVAEATNGCEDGNPDCGLGDAIWGMGLGFVAVSPIGVILVGNYGDERGSASWTYAGALTGFAVGLGFTYAAAEFSDDDTLLGLAASSILAAPIIGATIAFNLTRTYDSEGESPPLGSVLVVRDGAVALGIPVVSVGASDAGTAVSVSVVGGSL
jgi:hypothetical protein